MLPGPLEALGTTSWENPHGQRLRRWSSRCLQCKLTAPQPQGLHWGGHPRPRLSPTGLCPLPSVSEPLCLGWGGDKRESVAGNCPADQCDGHEFHSQPFFLPLCPEWPPSLQLLVTGNKHRDAVSASHSLRMRAGVG